VLPARPAIARVWMILPGSSGCGQIDAPAGWLVRHGVRLPGATAGLEPEHTAPPRPSD
jgi:hypothetical protein